MRHPAHSPTRAESTDSLKMLTALGFGPDTVLMNDPKLFVDGRFLASLLVELQEELGPKEAHLALFQIGLFHGLRDAARVCRDHDQPAIDGDLPDTTSLVMHWAGGARTADSGAFSLEGVWPERHEAVARCARLGASTEPACWMSAGYTTGWLSGTLNRPLVAREVECTARGDDTCRFQVQERSVWQASGEPEMEWLLSHMAFETFRKVAVDPSSDCPETRLQDSATEGRFDRFQPAVHIWGPVMVLPFTTLDEALGTVDMLGRDPENSGIRVVVIDLRERPLDEGFGAAALEQVLETIESWDAQSLITGVCPASNAALESLESSHLVLRKDLSEAIATAFQIADAARHQL